jgi:hypothetical protein
MIDLADMNCKSNSESGNHRSSVVDMNESQTSNQNKIRDKNIVKFSPFITLIGEDIADDSKYAGDESMAMSAIFGSSSDDSISCASKTSSTQQRFQASIDMDLVRQQQRQSACGFDDSIVSTATDSVYMDAMLGADERVQGESRSQQGRRQPQVEPGEEDFDGNDFQSFGSFSFVGSAPVAQDSVASFTEEASYAGESLKESDHSFSLYSLLGVARSVTSVWKPTGAFGSPGPPAKCSVGTAVTAGGLMTAAVITVATRDDDDEGEGEGQSLYLERAANQHKAAGKEGVDLQYTDMKTQGGDDEDEDKDEDEEAQSGRFSSSEQEDDESTVDVAEQNEKQIRRTFLSAVLFASGVSIVGGWLARTIYRAVHRNDHAAEEEAIDAVAHGAVEGASNGFVQIGPGALQQSQTLLLSQSTHQIGSTTGATAAMQGGTQ